MAKKAATKTAGGSAGTATGTSSGRPMTKGELYTQLAHKTGLSKKQVSSVFDGLTGIIAAQVGKRGPGLFQLPGLAKIKVVHKPATKAKMGINPFTKAPMQYKAKPARRVVKVLALKSLKEMA
jgi:nucleoid DNA-binding protein